MTEEGRSTSHQANLIYKGYDVNDNKHVAHARKTEWEKSNMFKFNTLKKKK